MNKSTLYIFDFDKTLIRQDSFRMFSLLASRNILEKIMVIVYALYNKVGIISNENYKELVLNMVWVKKKQEKDKILKSLFDQFNKNQNRKVINHLNHHLEAGQRVVVISASPTFYIKPYFDKWSKKIEVFGSDVFIINGKHHLRNLYGESKAECVINILKGEKIALIWFYTDHISDLPVIQLSDRVMLVNPTPKLRRKLNQLKINYEII